MVRDWLKRDELTDEIFDILDCLGKGYSFTEIIWDTSTGQWMPLRLEWRDPRWFRFDRNDLKPRR
jgi:phage gp29-like protein